MVFCLSAGNDVIACSKMCFGIVLNMSKHLLTRVLRSDETRFGAIGSFELLSVNSKVQFDSIDCLTKDKSSFFLTNIFQSEFGLVFNCHLSLLRDEMHWIETRAENEKVS